MSNFDLWYEDLGHGRANLHCLVHRWNPSVARDIEDAANAMAYNLTIAGFTEAYAVGAEHPDFCEYMGGEFLGVFSHDGIEYEVFRWELQPQS